MARLKSEIRLEIVLNVSDVETQTLWTAPWNCIWATILKGNLCGRKMISLCSNDILSHIFYYFPHSGPSRLWRLCVSCLCPWRLWGEHLHSLPSSQPGCYSDSLCALLHSSQPVGEGHKTKESPTWFLTCKTPLQNLQPTFSKALFECLYRIQINKIYMFIL